MTVYRVINQDPKVSPQTAAAVQQAMRNLNFIPAGRRNAKGLGFDDSFLEIKHRRFAFLIPDINVAALQTPLTGRLLHGIDTVLAPRGLDLSLTRLPAKGQLPDLITKRNVDGVIVRSNLKDDYPVAKLQSLPCVWLMESREQAPAGDIVHTDDAAIGHIAAQILLKREIRDVAVINECEGHDSYMKRINAFTSALQGTGAKIHRIEADNEKIDHMVALIKEFVSKNSKTQAFFLPGTMPILNRLHQALISSGRDPSKATVISASYDPEVTDSIRPKPIHVDSLPEELGEAAAELLLWRLSHPNAADRRISLTPRVIGKP